MISDPWIAGLVTLVIFACWMGFVLLLKNLGKFPGGFSRKLIHIGTGPIFILCWLLFPEAEISRFIAAVIPFVIVVLIILTGTRVINNQILVKLMSRNGNAQELFSGPLFYGIVFIVLTILFWKTIHAVIPLIILCAGDGFADVIGGRTQSSPIPWGKKKTIAGSIAMFIFGTVFCLAMIWLFPGTGISYSQFINPFLAILIINLASTVVESFSPSNVDNLSVPAVALIGTLAFFPLG